MIDLCWRGGLLAFQAERRGFQGPHTVSLQWGVCVTGNSSSCDLSVESERRGVCAAGRRLEQLPSGGKRDPGKERIG